MVFIVTFVCYYNFYNYLLYGYVHLKGIKIIFRFCCYCSTLVIITLVRVYSSKFIFAKEDILNYLLELFQLDWLLYLFCRCLLLEEGHLNFMYRYNDCFCLHFISKILYVFLPEQ